ncbi:predicted protein [Naegleria gruberi]|uniref:Predicted protein n=1 Tax=Naegleria gruberi TaxID=5762 RepID=D2W496_NAEGR|nr:uncharacterized protein NAEGRDRAFT_76226 [Naegleria gruberi]EFC36111.1 predicted protein [Naegleria gruberi]|eukprot:XP_002668855.1 predicted protein [Naegleria gruberi strain NEG-M]
MSSQPKRLKSVGLTGICSGKSTVVSYLGELIKEYEQLHSQSPSEHHKIFFHVIPTDELGWKAYSVGTECYKQVVEVFTPLVKQIVGEEASLLDEQQQINRRMLGNYII